jgi:hypothetical protein
MYANNCIFCVWQLCSFSFITFDHSFACKFVSCHSNVVLVRHFLQLSHFVSLFDVMQVVIDRHPVRFFVHKRPHVDFFLDVVSIYLLV